MYNQSNTCIIHDYGATPLSTHPNIIQYNFYYCAFLHRYISHMHPQMTYVSHMCPQMTYVSHMCLKTTYVSHSMVPYKHSAHISLGTFLIQIVPMPLHLTTQKITRSIDYGVPFHLNDMI